MKYVLRICVVLITIALAWKILEPEIANLMFQDDLRDLSTQVGSRIGQRGERTKVITNAKSRTRTALPLERNIAG